MMYNKYNRVLLKLSGEALQDKQNSAILDSNKLNEVAVAIKGDAGRWAACSESMQDYINEIIGLVDGYVVEDEVIIDISGLY